MRVKKNLQRHLYFASVSGPKIVLEFEEKHNRISALLDGNPAILDLVDRDLKRSASQNRSGRKGSYTSENILRALLVQRIETLSFRDTIVRVAHSDFLRDFTRLGGRGMMDFTFLNKCFNAVRPETWREINELQTKYAEANQLLDPSKIRTDTTLTEVNIHFPTDSSLLWDSYRVQARLLRRARPLAPELRAYRFHDRKAKKLHLFITRYSSSKNQRRKREVKERFKKLIGHVRRMREIAGQVCQEHGQTADLALRGLTQELSYYQPAIKTVLAAAERAAVKGETVPASDRVFSIFEQHAELIKRGRRGKPVEFGHMIQLTQSRDKFITSYRVMEKRIPDSELLEPTLENHKRLFGEYPDVAAADGGFWAGAEQMKLLGEKVKVIAVPRKATDWGNQPLSDWQGFRAGIEGTISVLKRAFGLLRCLFRGYKNFASSVGLSVFCHNLVRLAEG